MKSYVLTTAAVVLLSCATASAETAVPKLIAKAVANLDRPDEDRQRDTNRKPGEVLDFAHVRPGDKVADFIPGTGYFSRIPSLAVGPKGHVYAFVPVEFSKFKKQPPPSNGSTPYPLS